jgi:low affinity Fe/Cu permease
VIVSEMNFSRLSSVASRYMVPITAIVVIGD